MVHPLMCREESSTPYSSGRQKEAGAMKTSKYRNLYIEEYQCKRCDFKWTYKTVRCPLCRSQAKLLGVLSKKLTDENKEANNMTLETECDCDNNETWCATCKKCIECNCCNECSCFSCGWASERCDCK
jgi:hypothetical protein